MQAAQQVSLRRRSRAAAAAAWEAGTPRRLAQIGGGRGDGGGLGDGGGGGSGALMSEHVFEFLARVTNALARQRPLAQPIALTSLCEGRSFEAGEKRREKNGDRRRPQAGHGGGALGDVFPLDWAAAGGRRGRRISSRRVFSARQLILIGCGRKVPEPDEPGRYLVCVLLVGPSRAHDENGIKIYVIASSGRDWSTMQSTFECVFIKYQVS